MSQPHILITTYIASTPDKVWQALTNPEITEKYWYGTRVESDWQIGSQIIYRRQGLITDEHLLLKVEPYRLLRHTFHPVLAEIFRREKPSTVSFEITDLSALVRLTLAHDEFEENSAVFRACSETWPMLLSSLKTLLETGRPLPSFAAAAEPSIMTAPATGALNSLVIEPGANDSRQFGRNNLLVKQRQQDEWSI